MEYVCQIKPDQNNIYIYEELEDTKMVIRIHKSKKDRNTIAKRKRTKEQTTIYKTYT
jgi:hypothetical protein